MSHSEFEASPGLPERLPTGETLIWQGSPDWRLLALGAYRLRELSWYFGLLMVWHAVWTLTNGGSMAEAMIHALWTLPLAAIVMTFLCGMAILSARTTVYSMTSKRLVLRFGTALPLTVNLPYCQIESASVKMHDGFRGDISLAVSKRERVAYLMLWPHARPWRYTRPEPSLRAIPDAERVAVLLASALEESARSDQPVVSTPSELPGRMQQPVRGRDVPASTATALAS